MQERTAAEVDQRTDALLAEAEAYFMGEGGVHNATAAIAGRLAEAGIDYAIAGAIALGEHGFKRLTADVDVLIRREDLDRFKAEWLASGMTAPHRLQDLADVLRLIREAELTQDFGARLDPYVRDKFQELWLASQHPEDDY